MACLPHLICIAPLASPRSARGGGRAHGHLVQAALKGGADMAAFAGHSDLVGILPATRRRYYLVITAHGVDKQASASDALASSCTAWPGAVQLDQCQLAVQIEICG